jgi:hypothetical protein
MNGLMDASMKEPVAIRATTPLLHHSTTPVYFGQPSAAVP